MTSDIPARAVLDLSGNAVLIVDPAGLVQMANRSALDLIGSPLEGRHLADVVAMPAADLASYLRTCSGSASPLIGSIDVKYKAGLRRTKIYGSRIASGAGLIGLRLDSKDNSEFSVLSRKVSELNAEIHQRRRAQAVLEEALRQNELLFRELNHRIKNNIQFIIGLFSVRRREPGPAELHDFIDVAVQRLMAIGTVQRLMYETDKLGELSADEFVRRLVHAIAETFAPTVDIEVTASQGRMSHDKALPLALILNELLTNAAKHGARDNGRILVDFTLRGSEYVLSVEDGGGGLSPAAAAGKSSGLGLVRGLCRQIGARIDFTNSKGLRCEVSFPAETGNEQP
jgi:two-component sensor histidine kinase